MRYDKRIMFVKEETVYNYDTGNHDTIDVIKDMVYANITHQSEERMQLAYGTIKQDSLTIRLQNHYDGEFDYISYNGKSYVVDSQKKLRRDHVLWVSAL